jgi:hypothetical protein
LTKTDVGLANVDNTSDASKPVSTAQQTALNGKENTITAGTTSQYWRGDKSWQTLPAPGISDAPSDSKTYGRKNAAWAEVTAGGGGASVTIGDSPGSRPSAHCGGSDTGSLYIWYDDGTSMQWVATNSIGAQGPGAGVIGDSIPWHHGAVSAGPQRHLDRHN